MLIWIKAARYIRLSRRDSLANSLMRICTVVGARPQFIKAGAVSPALKAAGIQETVVHAGQHYDDGLSAIFFEELGLAAPARNLLAGSGSHAEQTGRIMRRLEAYLDDIPSFDAILVYGDTNSTLAGALVAAKANIPLAHVEAGLRSWDRSMPEEVNRIVTDCLSTLLLAPTQTAVHNLEAAGLGHATELVGDVMLDAVRHFAPRAEARAPLNQITAHASGTYALATVHRAANTDTPSRLDGIFGALGQLPWPVLLPLHPRTRARLTSIAVPTNVEVMDPIGYLSMLTLQKHARTILTDSGGIQKEAYWHGIPCITLRENTEWTETLEHGWNHCVGADPASILHATQTPPTGPRRPLGAAPDGGSASAAIARALIRNHRR